MRFLSIYTHAPMGAPPSPEHIAAMGKLIEEGMKAGWLIATEGVAAGATGARVRRSGGEITVTDGPFTEAKEVIGGYALLEAKSRQAAIDLSRQFLKVAGDGSCELIPLFEHPASGDRR